MTNGGDYSRPPIAAIIVIVVMCGLVGGWPFVWRWMANARQRYIESRMFVTTALVLDPDEPHDAVEIAREAICSTGLAELLLVPNRDQFDEAMFLLEQFDVTLRDVSSGETVTVQVTYFGDSAEAVMFGAPVTRWTATNARNR